MHVDRVFHTFVRSFSKVMEHLLIHSIAFVPRTRIFHSHLNIFQPCFQLCVCYYFTCIPFFASLFWVNISLWLNIFFTMHASCLTLFRMAISSVLHNSFLSYHEYSSSMHSHSFIYHYCILYCSYIFCYLSVWPCAVFSPVPLYNFCFCSLPSDNSSTLSFLSFIYLCCLSGFGPFIFLICVNLLSFWAFSLLSRTLSSFLPSFSPSPSLSVWHRVSQSPWWCAPLTLPPHTVLPPSCVNMLVIWAAPPCAESRLGGLKETEPTWACTGLDLWVHMHTLKHTHTHTHLDGDSCMHPQVHRKNI